MWIRCIFAWSKFGANRFLCPFVMNRWLTSNCLTARRSNANEGSPFPAYLNLLLLILVPLNLSTILLLTPARRRSCVVIAKIPGMTLQIKSFKAFKRNSRRRWEMGTNSAGFPLNSRTPLSNQSFWNGTKSADAVVCYSSSRGSREKHNAGPLSRSIREPLIPLWLFWIFRLLEPKGCSPSCLIGNVLGMLSCFQSSQNEDVTLERATRKKPGEELL